jgi:hypothetical protein
MALPTSRTFAESVARSRVGALCALAGTLIGFALSAWMAASSDGFHQDDDLTHLQFARWSSTHPEYLLHNWGRPGFTVLYALPAQFGVLASRLFSGALTALTAWLAYVIARRMGIAMAPLAPVLVWLQPLTFTLSYTTLTETPLAFYLALSMWLCMRRWFALSAAVLSMCLLTRHECAVWLPLWALAFWRGRAAWYAYALLAWAPIAHNILSGICMDYWPFTTFFEAKPTDEYGHGSWFAMLGRWVPASTAGLLVLAFAGAWRAARRPEGWLWIGAGLAYFLANTIIFRYGLFASGGYPRFLTPIAPVVAVAAVAAVDVFYAALRCRDVDPATLRDVRGAIGGVAAGAIVLWLTCEAEMPDWLWWARVYVRIGAFLMLGAIAASWWFSGSPVRWVRVLAVIANPALCLWFAGYHVRLSLAMQPPARFCGPLILLEDQLLIREAADWVHAQGLADRKIISDNPWVNEFMGITGSPFNPAFPHALERLQPGDIVFWERRYAGRPGKFPPETMLSIPGMVELWHGREHSTDGVYCRIYELRAAPASAASAAATTAPAPDASQERP